MEQCWSRFSEDFIKRQTYVVGDALIAQTQHRLANQRSLGEVLELGCGTGGYTTSILPEATSIIATDYSDEMVHICRNRFSTTPNIRVEQVDCCNTPFADNSFDTVCMANLIHIIPSPECALKEAHRVLKNNGTLLITCFTFEKMSILHLIMLLYRYRKTFGPPPKGGTMFTVHSLSKVVTACGFSVVETGLLGTKTKSIFLKAQKN